MERIVKSSQLIDVPLPREYVGKDLRITISLVEDEIPMDKPRKTAHDFIGIFSEYVKPGLAELEKDIWEMVVMEKYGPGGCKHPDTDVHE